MKVPNTSGKPPAPGFGASLELVAETAEGSCGSVGAAATRLESEVEEARVAKMKDELEGIRMIVDKGGYKDEGYVNVSSSRDDRSTESRGEEKSYRNQEIIYTWRG